MPKTNENDDVNSSPTSRSNAGAGFAKSTSIGQKLIYVLITGLLSLIPLGLVGGVLSLRDHYATTTINRLELEHGGRQVMSGPFIVVPRSYAPGSEYIESPDGERKLRPEPAPLALIPETLAVNGAFETREVRESLYKAISYDARIALVSEFENLGAGPDAEIDENIVRDWDNAYAVVLLSSTASTRVRPELKIGARTAPLSPGMPASFASYFQQNGPGYSAPLRGFLDESSRLTLETEISFSGATSFSLTPIGKSVEAAFEFTKPPSDVKVFSGEPDPEYAPTGARPLSGRWIGTGPYRGGPLVGFLSELRSSLLAKQNFEITYDAGNIRPYKDIRRALQYGFFLMGFSFLTLFVFDALHKRYIHSAQYFLLGLIQSVFYAILLAVAEFVGFDRGFQIAAAPTVLVTALSLAVILRSPGAGILGAIIFAAFYAVQYILMDMAQYSLLVAAGAAFVAIAATLLATSRLEWGRFQKT